VFGNNLNIYESRDDPGTTDVIHFDKMANEDVILASVSTIIAVAAAKKRRRRNRSCWVRDFNFDSAVFTNIHEVSTLLPIRSTLLPIRSSLSPVCTGPKPHGRLCRLSTKSTVLNSTLSPVCIGISTVTAVENHARKSHPSIITTVVRLLK